MEENKNNTNIEDTTQETENKERSKTNNTLDAEYEMINKNKDNSSTKLVPLMVICAICIIAIIILGCFTVYSDLKHKEALDQIDTLNSEVEQLNSENNELQKELDTLRLQYEDLEKQYLSLEESYNSLNSQNNSNSNNEDNQIDKNNNTDQNKEYAFVEENGVYKVTANDITKAFKADKNSLKPMVNHIVEITGKVKSYEFADTSTILNKKVQFPAIIKLDKDELTSFKGIDCEFKDMSINSFIANNQSNFDDNCYVRIKGTAALGIAFSLNECTSIEVLDSNGNVLDTWTLEK